METREAVSCGVRGGLHPHLLAGHQRAVQAQRHPIRFDGRKIKRDGLWCVYEFGQQLDAMMVWDRFKGRWLLGDEFSLSRAAGEYAEDEGSESLVCLE